MFDTRVRDRPHIARARVLSSRGVSVSSPFSWATLISSTTVHASWPLGPLTVTVWPSRVTVTPCGIATAFLPIRDILIDPEKDFAADIGVAGGGVGHDALGGRQHRDAEAVLDRLQVTDGRVDAASRLGHAA